MRFLSKVIHPQDTSEEDDQYLMVGILGSRFGKKESK